MQIDLGKTYCPNRKKSPSLPRNRFFAIISQTTRVPNPLSQFLLQKNGKGSKKKGKKTEHHCNFRGKDNHDESKCFKKMAALEAAMNKHHIKLDSSSEANSHGHVLCASSG